MIRSVIGLFLFFRFVGPRKIRIFEPLASYLMPDSEVGAIKTYVRLVGLVEAEREVTELLSHISRLGDNEPHHFTLSRFISIYPCATPVPLERHDRSSGEGTRRRHKWNLRCV